MSAFLLLLAATTTYADDAPGNHVEPITLSPDGRYGITVPSSPVDLQPDGSYAELKDPQNALIDVKTGLRIGVIQGDTAFEHMNHDHLEPTCWAADDSIFLWQVDGKWGYATEVLVSLRDGKIVRQIDVLALLQQEILKRTQAASPEDYAAVKSTSAGFGSWFHDGFAIDCVLNCSTPLTFPVQCHVFLTSNTKSLPNVVNVDSRMTAELNRDGTIKVKDFHLGQDPPAREWGH